MATGCRTLHDEELHKSHASQNIVTLMRSGKKRLAGRAARMGKMRIVYKVLVGKPERKNYLEDLGIDRKIILEWMLGKYGGKLRT
jgi:hypothetical protein